MRVKGENQLFKLRASSRSIDLDFDIISENDYEYDQYSSFVNRYVICLFHLLFFFRFFLPSPYHSTERNLPPPLKKQAKKIPLWLLNYPFSNQFNHLNNLPTCPPSDQLIPAKSPTQFTKYQACFLLPGIMGKLIKVKKYNTFISGLRIL